MKSILVDTNVFGILFDKRKPDLFGAFDKLIKSTVQEPHNYILTHYAVSERIGPQYERLDLPLPKKFPQYEHNQQTFDLFGKEACDIMQFLRDESLKHFSLYISSRSLEERYLDQVNTYWKNSASAQSLLDQMLPVRSKFKALSNDLLDLFSVDFQNGYSQIPKTCVSAVQTMNALSILCEYLQPRNIVLGRLFKKMWLDRISSHPSLSKETLQKCHDAMMFRNSEDFVDLELIYFSLIGHFSNQKYNSVVCFTRDPADKVKRRLYIVKAIIDALNKDVFAEILIGGRPMQIHYNFGKIYIVDDSLGVLEVINPAHLTQKDIV